MDLLELFVTACVPVFNMLLVTGVGSFLATDFAGILSKEARKHLNNVSNKRLHESSNNFTIFSTAKRFNISCHNFIILVLAMGHNILF